ncbi:MAG: biotin synthase BioB, partial [Lachnospirales bacterium]
TSGRTLNDTDFEKALTAYRRMKSECKLSLCASHGFLSEEQFRRLHEAGVESYHSNIETSRRFFPFICTTHTFDEKINTIKNAKKAGLEICSGGIIGLGETVEDRISMAFTLKELDVNSIPINVLTPIPNTPFENNTLLNEDEILRTVAIFRYINPKAEIRIAAGRNRLKDNGINAFYSGANATITGDFLTTTGSTIAEDIKMFKDNKFTI